MDIYHKYIITYEKKEPSFFEKLLRKKETKEVWAPGIINGFRDKINAEIFRIVGIIQTNEKMEVFGKCGI